jgi:hypothetical protein
MKPPYGEDLAMFYNTNIYCDYFWSFDSSKAFRELILTSDGFRFQRNQRDGQILKLRWPQPFDNGYTNGIGSWLQVTNIDGTSVPLQYEFTAFTPIPSGGTSNDLKRLFLYSCVVSNIQSGSIDRLPVCPPVGRVMVTDRRFQSLGYTTITYVITNGFWIPIDNPLLANRISFAKKSTLEDDALVEFGTPHQNGINIKYFIWPALALPACFVFIQFGVRAVNHNKRK